MGGNLHDEKKARKISKEFEVCVETIVSMSFFFSEINILA